MIEEAKFLDTKGNPAPGIAYTWDKCSKTVCANDLT